MTISRGEIALSQLKVSQVLKNTLLRESCYAELSINWNTSQRIPHGSTAFFFFFFQYSLALSYMEQILLTILKLLVKLELIGISMGVGTP